MSITLERLTRCNKRNRRHKGEADEQYVARQTHVTLVRLGLTTIANMRHCRSVTSLYLHDNKFSSMQGLQRCLHITHLYLQHNCLVRIEALKALTKLTKLYLGHNAIGVVEGLEALESLRELHIGHQRLPEGEALVFDPRTVLALQSRLVVLDVSGNGLRTLFALGGLQALEQLNVSDNCIADLGELAHPLRSNFDLWKLCIAGNPICGVAKHQDEVIVLGPSLTQLDERIISATNRQFLVNWKAAKSARAAGKKKKAPRPRTKTASQMQMRNMAPRIARFPSKLSVQNPNWTAPAPSKRASQQTLDLTVASGPH